MNDKAKRVVLLDDERELLINKLESDIKTAEEFIENNVIEVNGEYQYKDKGKQENLMLRGITPQSVIDRLNKYKRIVAKLG